MEDLRLFWGVVLNGSPRGRVRSGESSEGLTNQRDNPRERESASRASQFE